MNLNVSSLSVVIPVYNDMEVLSELYRRLKPVVDNITSNHEIVLVDDGSTDDSWNQILTLREQDSNIVAVKLARNCGQMNSIAAGLDIAENEIVVLMDSDLQDRPEDIPLLVEALFSHNVSMAVAQWEQRGDSRLKIFLSNVFHLVSNRITSIHKKPFLGVFRAIRRELIDELDKFPEKTATTICILYYIGSDYVAVPLKREARVAGESGYTLRKMLSITFSRIFSFSMVPIRLATYTGIGMSLIGIFCSLILLIRRFYFEMIAPAWIYIAGLLLFLFGLTFIFLGILGEYVGKILIESKKRPNYVIGRLLKNKT